MTNTLEERDIMANNAYSYNDDNSSNSNYNEYDNNQQNNILSTRDFYDDYNDNNQKSDKIKEISRDKLNNNLMSRMGSDIDIRRFKDPRNRQKSDFEAPFADDAGDEYASAFVSLEKMRR
jgi:hypothetical protein